MGGNNLRPGFVSLGNLSGVLESGLFTGVRMRWVIPLLALGLILPADSQDKKKPAKEKKSVEQEAIDKAIDKGIAFLKQKVMDPKWDQPFNRPANWPPNVPTPPPPNRQSYELVLWTFLHAGVAEKDPAFQKLLKPCVEEPLWNTYNVGLLAMILQGIDGAKYQKVIASCAQFFADTQCANGQWSYGGNYKPNASVDRKVVPAKKNKDGTTENRPTIKIKKGQPPAGTVVAPQGDNSNSQYAALGIRACHEAGVELPDETLKLAKSWWEKTQCEDGSWSYTHYEPPAGSKVRPAGEKGYGSMTCGGIGALAILKTVLKEEIGRDPQIKRAFDWLGKNFTVTDNPGHNMGMGGILPGGKKMILWYFYYLYGLERAGDLTSTEKFGEHEWYPEGAKELIRIQNADGSWKEPSSEGDIWATCFAILFLKRATQPLIKTGEAKAPPPKPADEPPKEEPPK